MKKLVLFIALFAALLPAMQAQVCTPDSAHFTGGTVVYPASLPCITQGATYTGTTNIRIPDSLDAHIFFSALPAHTYYLYVDSIKLDSITGAPTGVNVASNPVSGIWMFPGQYGCVNFSGTTADTVGSYPLSLYGRGCVHGNIGGQPVDSCQTGLLPSFVNFSLSVCAPVVTGVCTPDSTHFTSGVYFYPPTQPCIYPGTPFAGTVSIKIPDSVDAHLFVSAVPANTYYLHIDSMRIDSIVGSPTGISIATNPDDSVWLRGGQFGCTDAIR